MGETDGKGASTSTRDDVARCANGCGKPGTKRCKGCKAAFYCSVACHKTHWKTGGHRAVCRKTRAPVEAVRVTAEMGRSPTRDTSSVCIICLDVGDAPPIQSGCGCRGDAGLAHVDCRAEACAHRARGGIRDGWLSCGTCHQLYTGRMKLGLAETLWSIHQDSDEQSQERQWAAGVLAAALNDQGRCAESEAICREVRAVHRRMKTPDPDRVVAADRLLANILIDQGRHAEAEGLYREVLGAQQRMLPPNDPATLRTMMNLGNVVHTQGKLAEALARYEDLRSIQKRVLGPDHLDTMTTSFNIAATLSAQSKVEEAEVMLRDVLKVQQRVLGAEHPATLTTIYSLCIVLTKRYAFGEAETRCLDLLSVQQRLHGPHHSLTESTAVLLEGLRQFKNDPPLTVPSIAPHTN
jgi:tetratricopeptide (TPR) repeat protein